MHLLQVPAARPLVYIARDFVAAICRSDMTLQHVPSCTLIVTCSYFRGSTLGVSIPYTMTTVLWDVHIIPLTFGVYNKRLGDLP